MKNFISRIQQELLLVLVFSFLLASCGNQNPNIVTIENCPAVGAVSHMTALTRFAGPEKTNDQVEFDAYLTDLDSECRDNDGVTTTISFTINAKRGSALQNNVQTINYYVVVIRDNFLITAKQSYSTQIRFSPGQQTAGVRETILQRFDDSQTLKRYDYEVLVGFELEPDEFQFNIVR